MKGKQGHTNLSASISSEFLPCAKAFTIQAVSKAARKPRAQPVPIGQKGCEENKIIVIILGKDELFVNFR